MKLTIDRNVPVPAYQQVVDGITRAIAQGDVDRGSRLPSVRNLASQLGLNVNTVARAYRDLERAGVIVTQSGLGSFVAALSDATPAAAPGSTRAQVGAPTTPPATGVPAAGAPAPAAAPSWRDLLIAAVELAVSRDIRPEEVAEVALELATLAQAALGRRPLLVTAASEAEAADLVAALPPELMTRTGAVTLDGLEARLAGGDVVAVLTSFPAQADVRRVLDGSGQLAEVVALETEHAESVVQALSGLLAEQRLALITMERERWDHEANDVMKVIGRGRWLKTVVLEHGERGLEERLENVDVVLHVSRVAADIVPVAARLGKPAIELVRQVTARTRKRLEQVSGVSLR